MAGKATFRKQGGFTLIEIMAVLVIIGVVTTIAVISVKALGGRDPEGQAATRLAGLIELASENARMENIQYGLVVKPHSYQFARLGGNNWAPVTNDPTLGVHHLPAGVEMTVTVQNAIKIPMAGSASNAASAAVPASASSGSTADTTNSGNAKALHPQIAILSTGELTPFTLRLTNPQNHKVYVLRGDNNGQIHIQAPNASSTGSPAQD